MILTIYGAFGRPLVDAKWLVPNPPPRLGATAPQKWKNMFRLSKFRRHFGRDSKNSRIRGLNGKSYQKTLRGLIVGLLETIQPGHFFLKIFVNTVARGPSNSKTKFQFNLIRRLKIIQHAGVVYLIYRNLP